jgi:hypothetical protein
MYKFLDSKSLGYFTNKRWANFYNLFVNPFIECDKNNDCLLNNEELKECFSSREDMKVVESYMSDRFNMEILVEEIITSLDFMKIGGLNLSNYLLLKRIVIGFRQYHVMGYLDKETFYSALKTTFMDHILDEVDSEIAFRIALNLMFEKIKNYSLDFAQYFEICRLVNSFLSYGVNLGEGFITKDQLLRNYEGERIPSKLNSLMFEKYFDLFSEDFKLDVKTDSTKFDPNTLRFEDHAVLEFWANIFRNYTDPAFTIPTLNITGFKNLFLTNKYVRKKYFIYIAYSNFEDYDKINATAVNTSNITDFDFLTNFGSSFLETNIEMHLGKLEIKNKLRIRNKNRLRKNTNAKILASDKSSSVFSSLSSTSGKSMSMSTSLFDLKLTDDEDGSNGSKNDKGENLDKSSESQTDLNALVDSALQYYFNILDLNINNYITYEEFVIFLKYIRLFDRLNKDNSDKRGVLKSNCVNCK